MSAASLPAQRGTSQKEEQWKCLCLSVFALPPKEGYPFHLVKQKKLVMNLLFGQTKGCLSDGLSHFLSPCAVPFVPKFEPNSSANSMITTQLWSTVLKSKKCHAEHTATQFCLGKEVALHYLSLLEFHHWKPFCLLVFACRYERVEQSLTTTTEKTIEERDLGKVVSEANRVTSLA